MVRKLFPVFYFYQKKNAETREVMVSMKADAVFAVNPLRQEVHAVNTLWNLTLYREKWGLRGYTLFLLFFLQT